MSPATRAHILRSPTVVDGLEENVRLWENMPFNNSQKREITEIVSEQITKALRPIEAHIEDVNKRQRFWKVESWKDLWPVLVTVGAIVVGVITIVTSESAFKASTNEKLNAFADSLKKVEARLNQMQAKESRTKLESPAPIQSDREAKEVKEAADFARTHKVPIRPDRIQSKARLLLATDNNSPAEWEAVEALADLKSSTLNDQLEEAKSRITSRIGPNDNGKWVDQGEGFLLYETSHPLAIDGDWDDQKVGRGIIVTNPKDRNSFQSVFRNVIFRNANIVITGKRPITLLNVFFENCTFEFPNTPTGRAFAKAIFDNAAVTLKT